MAAVVSLLVVLTLSLVCIRVGAIGLVHTGLSREAARFQARSAFTGVGFTTTESEKVVNHPVRRRIVMLLMLVGNVGFVTVISTSMFTFLSFNEGALMKAALLSGGLLALLTASTSPWVDRHLSRIVSVLLRRYTTLDARDYSSLLQLGGEYRVTELLVERDDWLSDRTLIELQLRDEGVLVLGINRADGTFVGAPRGTTKILPGDNVILYGKLGVCEELDRRRRGREGEAEHREAVLEQQRELEQLELQESDGRRRA